LASYVQPADQLRPDEIAFLFDRVKKDSRSLAILAGATWSTGSVRRAGNRVRVAARRRRQLTVMFCDLVGSTDLSARSRGPSAPPNSRRDPEDRRLHRTLGAARSRGFAIAAYHGAVAETLAILVPKMVLQIGGSISFAPEPGHEAHWQGYDTRHMLTEIDPKPDQITIVIGSTQMNDTWLPRGLEDVVLNQNLPVSAASVLRDFNA
jgi:hypothetical protein